MSQRTGTWDCVLILRAKRKKKGKGWREKNKLKSFLKQIQEKVLFLYEEQEAKNVGGQNDRLKKTFWNLRNNTRQASNFKKLFISLAFPRKLFVETLNLITITKISIEQLSNFRKRQKNQLPVGFYNIDQKYVEKLHCNANECFNVQQKHQKNLFKF